MLALDDDLYAHTVSFLAPPDMISLVRTSKSCLDRKPSVQDFQQSMRRQLEARLNAIQLVACKQQQHWERKHKPLSPVTLSLPSLFPDGVYLDDQDRPQCIIAGSLPVQAATGQQ